jgi:8-oxo-dGTP pyrophosphatase MutT (NUDIX family)
MKARSGTRQRSAAVVYRFEQDWVEYLLVSPRRNRDRLVLPGGMVGRKERHREAARRETQEEAGVYVAVEDPVGSYRHKRRAKPCRTDVYLATYVAEGSAEEGRHVQWLRYPQIAAGEVRVARKTRKLLAAAHKELTGVVAA